MNCARKCKFAENPYALRQLHEVTTIITAQTDILLLLDGILEVASQCAGGQRWLTYAGRRGYQRAGFCGGSWGLRHTLVGHRMPMGTGIAGWVAQHREPVIVGTSTPIPVSPLVGFKISPSTRPNLIRVPIVYNEQVLGVFQALNKRNGETFTEGTSLCLG